MHWSNYTCFGFPPIVERSKAINNPENLKIRSLLSCLYLLKDVRDMYDMFQMEISFKMLWKIRHAVQHF